MGNRQSPQKSQRGRQSGQNQRYDSNTYAGDRPEHGKAGHLQTYSVHSGRSGIGQPATSNGLVSLEQ